MRSAFLSLLGLLARLTFPICLVISGASTPIVRFVYGSEWAPAASALVWLGVLAAFKILFELTYDYLVVQGVSGSILAVQTITLATLVPALIVGAHLDGIAGLGAAQVVVAAGVILPMYLVRFHTIGVTASSVAKRLIVPILAAALVDLGAAALARAVPWNIVVVLLAGLLALAVVAALLGVDREQISRLRAAISVSPPLERDEVAVA